MEMLSNPVDGCSSRPLPGDDGLTDAAAELNCQTNQNICAHGSSIVDMDNIASSPGGPVPENGRTRSPLTESPTNSGPVGSTTSSPVPSIEDRSPSSPDDLFAEDKIFRSSNIDEAGSAVTLHADYVFYRDNYYPTALVTISAYSIKIESLDTDKDETLVFEWAIGEDVISIQSQWYARGSLVKVHIHLSAIGMVQTENLHNGSEVEELKVMLMDPGWMLSLEKIFSLNLRYKAVWKNHAFSQIADGGDALAIEKTKLSSGPYFPNFDEHFEDVIYPEGDVDPVSIGKRDVDLLQPETFINDTIIDFYIKYLKSKIPTVELSRFHFFNSFFFRKLADLDKNPDSVFDGKAAFQRVRKWTRKLSLFEKDYIFIPVNYNYHWSLIVICHPGRVASFAGKKMNLPSRVPCILHMDSIRGSHSGLKNLIQSYLLEEWKERQKEMSEDISSKFMNLRFLSLELPQQQNYYDCGLFLLHYVELFLEDAPDNFNPLNITKFSTFLTANWFIPADVSQKRPYIQRLIHGILAKRSEGVSGNSIGGEDDESQPSKLEEDNGDVHGVGLTSVSCNSQDTFTLGSTNSVSEQGFDMNIPKRPPVMSSHCPSLPASAPRDLFEPGTSGSLGKQYGGPRSTMLPTEEGNEDFEGPCFNTLYSTLNGTSLRPLDGLTYGGCKEANEGDNEDFKSPLYPMQSVSRSRQLGGLKSGGCSMKFFSPSSCAHNLDIREYDQEDDSSPDSYHSSDDEVKVIEEDSKSGDTLSAQSEKLDVTNCSFEEKFDTLGYIFTSAEMETPDVDPHQRSNGTHNISGQQDHISSVGEDVHAEDDSSPDSDLNSSDDEVEVAEEDSESRDTLSAQNEKPDLPKCSSAEKSDAVAGSFTSSSAPVEAIDTPSGSLCDHYKGYNLGSHGEPRVAFSPVEENIKDFNNSPLYSMLNRSSSRPLDRSTSGGCNNGLFGPFSLQEVIEDKSPLYSLLNQSSLRPSDQLTSGGCNTESFKPVSQLAYEPSLDLGHSFEDDQAKVNKGDSECRDTPALNETLSSPKCSSSALQCSSISRDKRRLPDDLLSPKEAEAQRDEWLITDERPASSDELHPAKRPKLNLLDNSQL